MQCISRSLSKNLFFDKLTEGKKAVKTTKPSPQAYKGTVGLGLGSKSKSLQSKGFLSVPKIMPVEGLCHREKGRPICLKIRILTVGGFFDTLREMHRISRFIREFYEKQQEISP